MIGTTQIVLFVIQSIVGLGVPMALGIAWCVKKKQKFTTFLIGAATFVIFALILETLVNNRLLFPLISNVKNEIAYKALYVLIGTCMAGIFEETGRYVVFKYILKKNSEIENAITYGLGHGGVEVIIVVGLSGIGNIAYAFLINSPMWEVELKQAAEIAPNQLAALEAIPGVLASATFGALLLSLAERIAAMLAHLGCSMVVFKAAKTEGKTGLYPLAIGLHAIFDIPAALSQVGVIKNLFVLEALLLVGGAAIFFGAYKLIYKK